MDESLNKYSSKKEQAVTAMNIWKSEEKEVYIAGANRIVRSAVAGLGEHVLRGRGREGGEEGGGVMP